MFSLEYVKLAIRSIRANLLRTSLTLGIVALGIMALIGIMTAITGIEFSLRENFTTMGANSFTINNEQVLRMHGDAEWVVYDRIDLDQAEAFKEQFDFPSVISLSSGVMGSATVKHGSTQTNPNIPITAVDENFLQVQGLNIQDGRNFTEMEVNNGNNVIILGSDLQRKIYKSLDTVIGSNVFIGSVKYKVVGVLEKRGANFQEGDNRALIPLMNGPRNWGTEESYQIGVTITKAEMLNSAVEEARGLFRNIRGVRINEKDDFAIERSDKAANEVISQLQFLRIATVLIGFLTLFGAGIGLMNIMLVSVNERTREIGVSKAIGANDSAIMYQFLTEAVMITLLGGFIGILLGTGAGALTSIPLKTSFVMPWNWVLIGLFLCILVGLIAGIYPAWRASKLNPVEALRYE